MVARRTNVKMNCSPNIVTYLQALSEWYSIICN
jgi:hypothetical protein